MLCREFTVCGDESHTVIKENFEFLSTYFVQHLVLKLAPN